MKIYSVLLILLLSGCAGKQPTSVPEGYSGETASVDDSFRRTGGGKADFFYIKAIDGVSINNAMIETQKASSGTARLRARGISRPVMIKPLVLTLVGKVHHFAPIGRVLNSGDNHHIEGELAFQPKAGELYLVNGYLRKDRSAIWIEDLNGNVVSGMLEKNGDDGPVLKKAATAYSQNTLTKEAFFLGLSGGETVNFVLAKLGKPDAITHYKGNLFNNERLPSETYIYDGLGSVELIAVRSGSNFVERIMPEVSASDDMEKLSLLMNTDGRTLQYVAKEYSMVEGLGVDQLDKLAQKLWVDKHTGDRYLIDALSWLCRILGNSGNPRYHDLLSQVAKQADNKKLRKYAQFGLEQLPQKIGPQFMPE